MRASSSAPDPAPGPPDPGVPNLPLARAAGRRPVSLRNRLSVLFIALATVAIQRGTTLDWAHAQSTDGVRYALSTVGLTRHESVTPGATTTEDCRWWPSGIGNAELCSVRPDGSAAMLRLRLAYPCLSIAIWLGVAAVFLQVLRVPRSARLRSEITWAVAALGLVALYAVTMNATGALTAVSNLGLDYATPGIFFVASGVLMAAVGGWLQRKDDG